MSIAG
jgi:alpha-tubulin suppressor-like RCC1 family protein